MANEMVITVGIEMSGLANFPEKTLGADRLSFIWD
jgi:hypothetical protein